MRNIFYVIVEKNERRNIEMFIMAKLQKQN